MQENNFLGSGRRVGIALHRSEFRTNVGFNYTNPYFTEDGVSAGYSLYARSSNYEEVNVSSFQTDSYGGSVSFGYPLSEISRLNFSLGYENLSIEEGTRPAQEISSFLQGNGDDFNTFSITSSWRRSTLNRGVLADRGASNQLSLEVSIPGSELEFYKLTYSGQLFRPLTKSLTLRLRTELGYGDSYGDTSRLPFFENFFAGGFGSVRGFQSNTLGPQDTPACLNSTSGELVALSFDECNSNPGTIAVDDPDPFGGSVLAEFGAEILFPVPFVKDQRSLQASFFVDAGNVFDLDCGASQTNCFEPDFGELRYSTGLGLTWISGFGPLTFSIAKPLNASDDDDEEVFQFSLGQTF